MRIELVSKLGARLPGDGGLLEFGATRADARRRLEGLGAPVRASFAYGGSWGWRARVGDRWVEASAGGDGLLGEIRVARAMIGGAVDGAGGIYRDGVAGTAEGGAGGIVVVYRGIDVFEHTMAEVELLLGAGEAVQDLRVTGVFRHGHALSVTLLDLTRPHSRG